ncbi:MAG: FimB/Mfa2 family fimbrial subunit, partial [Paraprevotella sp.]|nr:FimB/Mfa2 family fimbrial subunit [Paraprevotella sp.]
MKIKSLLLMLLAGWAFASCDMMEDDLSECPTGLYVSFKYDYNIQRADMFKDQVGGVRVYVLDENGRVVADSTVENTGSYRPLSRYGYQMHFANLKPGRYQIVALGMQKSYEEALRAPGAKFRSQGAADVSVGDRMEDMAILLDRSPQSVQITGNTSSDILYTAVHPVENNEVGLDTLWVGQAIGQHSLEDAPVPVDERDPFYTVVAMKPTYAVVPFVRATKNVSITLRQADGS